MKKHTYRVSVPVTVDMWVEVIAEDEDEAREITEENDFALEYGFNFGGGLFPVDESVGFGAREPNYDELEIEEIND